jgi:hypothetical protein
MRKKREIIPDSGPGTLNLMSRTAPLIQKPDRTASGKDMCAQVELASVGRNRDFPRESERAKALRLERDAMPTDPNPKVPDFDDDLPF